MSSQLTSPLGLAAGPHPYGTPWAGNAVVPQFGNLAHLATEQGLKEARAFVPTTVQTVVSKINEKAGRYFFQPVVEDYLMGTMAVDFIALWIPRASSALFRGVMDYDPSQDPEAQTKTGLQEFFYVAGQRFKRLNWPNFFEEWWREFASGPGFFMWPTACFLTARHLSKNKGALQIPRQPLLAMSDELETYLKRQGQQPKELRYSSFVNHLVDWDKLYGNRISKEKRLGYTKQTKDIVRKIANTLEKRTKLLEQHTLATLPFMPGRKEYIKINDQLRELTSDFHSKITNINTRYAGERHMAHDQLPLKINWGVGNVKSAKASDFTLQATQFYDFLSRLRKDVAHTNTPVEQVIHKIRNKTLHQKGLVSLITVGVTLGFLFKLVQWTQSNDHYVANRTQKLEKLFGLPGQEPAWSKPSPVSAIPLSPGVRAPLPMAAPVQQTLQPMAATTVASSLATPSPSLQPAGSEVATWA